MHESPRYSCRATRSWSRQRGWNSERVPGRRKRASAPMSFLKPLKRPILAQVSERSDTNSVEDRIPVRSSRLNTHLLYEDSKQLLKRNVLCWEMKLLGRHGVRSAPRLPVVHAVRVAYNRTSHRRGSAQGSTGSGTAQSNGYPKPGRNGVSLCLKSPR